MRIVITYKTVELNEKFMKTFIAAVDCSLRLLMNKTDLLHNYVLQDLNEKARA